MIPLAEMLRKLNYKNIHPHDVIFIVRTGRVLLINGDTVVKAKEGDIPINPAKIPHKYLNISPGPLGTTDIQLSD